VEVSRDHLTAWVRLMDWLLLAPIGSPMMPAAAPASTPEPLPGSIAAKRQRANAPRRKKGAHQ
jgi:hypothetical protein